MKRKRFKAEEIVNKLREADVLISQGRTIVHVCKQLGVTEQTYYRWRKEYGGLKKDQAWRLEELERENARLKRLPADAELDKAILREAAAPELLNPQRRRQTIQDLVDHLGVSGQAMTPETGPTVSNPTSSLCHGGNAARKKRAARLPLEGAFQ